MPKIKIDFSLDLKGEVCPYPSIITLKALKELKSGQVLEVVSDCSAALHNIPLDVQKIGAKVVLTQQISNDIRFLIKKE